METNKTYDSVVAGKFLLALAYERGRVLNVTKVQKLLYIIYGYFLAKDNRKIINETPKAWPYGPVFPRTRKHIDFGTLYKKDDPDLSEIKEEQEIENVFICVIDKYSKFSASMLSDWSHEEGSPWYKTTKRKGFDWNDVIPDEYICEYFSNIKIV